MGKTQTIVLTVLAILMLAVFVIGCEDGQDGLMGPGGCDFNEMKDPATMLCIPNPAWAPAVDGETGPAGCTATFPNYNSELDSCVAACDTSTDWPRWNTAENFCDDGKGCPVGTLFDGGVCEIYP